MGPVKFDDISKTAASVLNDDYQVSGHQFQAKQKTNFDGAVITTAVDLFPGKDAVVTPAKLTWKFPKPLGLGMVSVDKLEMDKAGKLKLEVSSDKAAKGVVVDCKSDLVDPAKITAACQYTGIKDTQLKLETKVLKPQDFVFEVTRSVGIAQCGLKCTQSNLTAPDVGLRVAKDALFCSILAKEKFSVFTAHGFYKASDKLKFAAMYEYGGKKSGSFGVGLVSDVIKGTTMKVKVQQDQSISCGVKQVVAKGLNLVCGAKYDTKSNGVTYGVKLNIE